LSYLIFQEESREERIVEEEKAESHGRSERSFIEMKERASFQNDLGLRLLVHLIRTV
jgi:hypothetical protein